MNDVLLERLLASKKYRDVCPDTIKRILSECSLKYKRDKEIEKAVKEQLHGITGAFMNEAEYKAAQKYLEQRDIVSLLQCHSSTRERMPIERMDDIYKQIFAITGVPETLLDLACGLNPTYTLLRHPEISVTGTDISGQSIGILKRLGINALHTDLLCDHSIPSDRFDAAFLFKVLPLLDRQRGGASMDVLNAINARFIVASYPTRTLSGRNVGMEANYTAFMETHIPKDYTITASFTAENELFFILEEAPHA